MIRFGVNAATKALERDEARVVVVCDGDASPAVLTAHLFAAAAARRVPIVDLKNLGGKELAQRLRLRMIAAFVVCRGVVASSDAQQRLNALLKTMQEHCMPSLDAAWVSRYIPRTVCKNGDKSQSETANDASVDALADTEITTAADASGAAAGTVRLRPLKTFSVTSLNPNRAVRVRKKRKTSK